jgi:predicted dehydrogenase
LDQLAMSASTIPALVVGTGVGCRIQIPALRAAGFNVVGLVGSDAARTVERARTNGVPQAFTDLNEAITRTGAMAVAVATPPHTHGPLTLTAIARGCHVLCEKPFAKDVNEARAMLAAAERAGVTHLIGHELRWLPERAIGARAIAEGLIGEPKFITFTQFIPYLINPLDMPEWWFDMEAGGGWLGAAGSHQIDWVRSWMGEFESLSAALPIVSSRSDGAEDTFVFRFRLANGAEGVMQQTAAAWGPPLDIVRVVGTKATLWVEGNAVWMADRDGSRQIPVTQEFALPPLPPLSDDPRRKTAKWQMLTQIELPPYTRLCQAWRMMIDGGRPPNTVHVPTFADGVACMEVLDAIRSSAANGGSLVSVQPREALM